MFLKVWIFLLIEIFNILYTGCLDQNLVYGAE